MDFHPGNLSDFYKACFVGNLEEVKRRLGETKRLTVENVSSTAASNSDIKHLAVLKTLIKSGGNVNARDVAGYSVFFHCVTAFGNKSETIRMAKVLLKAGVDPNVQNRFGCTPLHENIMTRNYEVLNFLAENGADPSVHDNDGITPHSLANFLPEGQKIFCKAGFLLGGKKRKEAKAAGVLYKCNSCGSSGAKKRCTRCLVTYYCDRQCQVKHWPSHKMDCTEKEKGKVEIEVKQPPGHSSTINLKNLNVTTTTETDLPKKQYFKVKVQVPIFNDNKSKSPLLVYDKKRTFQKWIESTDPNYDRICRKIKEEGVMQVKGYFYASLNKSGSLSFQIDHMLPPETW